jgi:large subunit ribosomal protein L2
MAIVKSKPTSPGSRFVVRIKSEGLHKGKPYAPLLSKLSKSGGRTK